MLMDRVRGQARVALIATIALAPTLIAAPADDWTPLASVEGITEYKLDNGLRVLLFPDASSSTVTVNITYFVGSNHEGRGEKGMAHLLEHMVFKGTPTHKNPWALLEDHGAQFNGTTWVDRTNYYETMVATPENLEFGLALEADRMQNSFVSEEDLRSEMTVVRNEFEMGENNPFGVTLERLLSSAFLWHNYGNTTIGNRSDIERVPAASLKKFYQHHYRPSNAMLVVAGKIDVGPTQQLIGKHFGGLKNPAEPIIPNWTDEPTQDGPRSFVVQRAGGNTIVAALYHIPAAAHPDSAPAQLLATVLSDQPTGRLYKALVEPGRCVSVLAFPFTWAERGCMIVGAVLREGDDPDAVERTLFEVVEGLDENPVTSEELDRARTQALTGIKLSLAESARIGIELTEWAAAGDWRLLFINRDRIKDVTAEDMNRVAGAYFMESNRTSGRFVPTKDPARAVIPTIPDVASLVKDYKGTETIAQGEEFKATPENLEKRIVRSELVPGVKLGLLNKETRGDKVELRVSLRFGDEKTYAGRVQAAELAPRMLMRGTSKHTFQELQDEISKLQSTMNVMGGPGAVEASITSDRANIVPMIALLAEVLREPSFPQDQFDIIVKEEIAQLEEGRTGPQLQLMVAMRRAMGQFPKDSVHYAPTIDESLERLHAVKLDDVKKLYAETFGASHGEAAVVGDFDAPAVTAALKQALSGWSSKTSYARIERPFQKIAPVEETIRTPDKQMSIVAQATMLEMRKDDPDYPALRFAGYILGQSAKSRLLNRLRQTEGLSYGAGAMMQADDQDPVTLLMSYAICANQNAAKAQESMADEIQKWIDGGVTDQELADGVASLRLQQESDLSDDGYVAGELKEGLYLGRTFAWHADQLSAIERLSVPAIADAVKRRLSGAPMVRMKAGDIE